MADHPDLPVVLCVDDEQQNLDFLNRSLRQEYEVKLTTSPEEAVTLLRGVLAEGLGKAIA